MTKPTNKQSQVLNYMLNNPLDTTNEIAQAFNNSPHTIRTHIKELCICFDAPGKRQLIKKAKDHDNG